LANRRDFGYPSVFRRKMAKDFRVFLASPGDVATERAAMDAVVDEVNQIQGSVLDYKLELIRWETHTAPGGGRPQQVINDMIGQYDIFVGVMWHRFGTPTGVAGSGTEEEFRIAQAEWEKDHERPLMFYFCQKPFMSRNLEEIEQFTKVLIFRKELEGKALVWDYEGPETFAQHMRKHLAMRMKTIVEGLNKPKNLGAQPKNKEIQELQELWKEMDPDLQSAFSIAYNENRRAGDGGIKTQDLFAALLRVMPKELHQIVTEIPKAALPEAVQGAVTDRNYIVQERPWLSHCISSSIHRLRHNLPSGRKLTAADIFADIAKHGTGQSVKLLREHKIGPAQIDAILQRKHIDVVGT
jgi:hypothetical protein